MVRYLSLISFTPEGISAAADSPQRQAAFCRDVEAAGGTVEATYWTLGEVDGVIVFTAPDEATAAALLLRLGTRGCVRTRTLRAFDVSEFAQIVNGI
jgi:uncharacterized protein with GYD domain